MKQPDTQKPVTVSEEVRIRPLRHADLPSLEWEGEFTHFRLVYAHAFQRAQKGNAVLWVAEAADGRLIGQVFVRLLSESDPQLADGSRRAFIHSFRVRPEHRNAGIGTRLIEKAEADLLLRGFVEVGLNVGSDNHAALRLYERLGYEPKHPVSGDWTFEDHMGVQRRVHEPGWRLEKKLGG